ncbi:uncharacterized protein RAG0_14383 [Rhynchosporium agropyri]|uniref:Peptidase A1 domain-containing protein n=1 Tax=Rhynchosporium agropyri TaxID=914238 RepID=A0A1E1LGV0_9HELO|nr:uncharacterized protein RAG0_14383 [Rhynchosporium agropyri]
MTRVRQFLVLATLFYASCSVDTGLPFALTWSSKTFGPDRPWQAIQIGIGTPAQQVALYPAGTFRSHVLTSKICSNPTLSPDVCYASAAGLYAIESSRTGLDTIVQQLSAVDYTHGGLQVQGSDGTSALDQMNIGILDSSRTFVIVPNVTFGTFGLGYLGTVNQTFSQAEQAPINGSLVPGFLQEKEVIPSNTFGLHIGSVSPKIKGSLHFGGYDQARICGNVSTQQGGFGGVEPIDDGKKGLIDLLDVDIVTYDGVSPFNSTRIGGLLAAGNSSIGPSLSLPLYPESPYLNLPKSTCDAIAAWLPVTYNANLGLYTWNTNDPQYQRIVSSPTVLRFVFRKDQSNTKKITINVPFMLLNLTLEAPLVASRTPYFPCNAQSRGRYSLGRAFLQAAFAGGNWNANNNQGVWWLAQAPGPNSGSQRAVKTIKDQDTVITSSNNDCAASWEGVLVPLNKQLQPTTNTDGSPGSSVVQHGDKTAGLSEDMSVGSKAGIGIGAVAVLLGIVSLCVFLWYRKRKERRGFQEAALTPGVKVSKMESVGSSRGVYRMGGYAPTELHGQGILDKHVREDWNRKRGPYGNEATPVYELDGGAHK